MILRNVSRFLPALIALVSLSAFAAQGIHIDASSDAAANKSFQRMLSSLDGNKRTDLENAITQLNASVDPNSPAGKERVSAARIKDKIGGMTATEIVDLAKQTAPAK